MYKLQAHSSNLVYKNCNGGQETEELSTTTVNKGVFKKALSDYCLISNSVIDLQENTG